MRVRVVHGIDDLASDMAAIPPKLVLGAGRAVRKNAKEGNRLAKGFARHSAGAHGKNYPDALSAEPLTALSWEYGPDANDPGGQGGMSFEHGSRNQPPHLDLARSADIIGPKFAADIGDVVDGLFW